MAGDPFTVPLNAIHRRVAYAHHIRITLERAPPHADPIHRTIHIAQQQGKKDHESQPQSRRSRDLGDEADIGWLLGRRG
jgi:hypothetical protein